MSHVDCLNRNLACDDLETLHRERCFPADLLAAAASDAAESILHTNQIQTYYPQDAELTKLREQQRIIEQDGLVRYTDGQLYLPAPYEPWNASTGGQTIGKM